MVRATECLRADRLGLWPIVTRNPAVPSGVPHGSDCASGVFIYYRSRGSKVLYPVFDGVAIRNRSVSHSYNVVWVFVALLSQSWYFGKRLHGKRTVDCRALIHVYYMTLLAERCGTICLISSLGPPEDHVNQNEDRTLPQPLFQCLCNYTYLRILLN